MEWRKSLETFDEIWICDTEYTQVRGNPISETHCIVATEVNSGRTVKEWVGVESSCPLDLSGNCLFVSWSNAELMFWLAKGWELPEYYIDLMTEYRTTISGIKEISKCGLLSALDDYKINNRSSPHKEAMRDLCIRGGDFTDDEREAILEYCAEDVVSTVSLYEKIIENKHFIVPFALWRGMYLKNSAKMRLRGIPINATLLRKMEKYNAELLSVIIETADTKGCYTPNWGSKKKEREGIAAGLPIPYSFRKIEFERVIKEVGAADVWPKTTKGGYSTDAGVCKGFVERFGLEDIFTCRQTVGQLKLSTDSKKKRMLDVTGDDSRVRLYFNEYGSKTGRNQPSTTQNPFGVAAWLRSLVRPEEGKALMYADFSGQEFAIAAALSQDQNMMDAYLSGDPHMGFGIRAGIVPEGSVVVDDPKTDEEKHIKKMRAQCKVVNLASLYGQQAVSIAKRLGITGQEATKILKSHHKVFKTFWRWQKRTIDFAFDIGYLRAKMGWTVNVRDGSSPLSIGNFPMQANGVVMLQAAVNMMEEAGVTILTTVHDAILVECDIKDINYTRDLSVACMEKASQWLLNGFTCRVDVEKTIVYPDHYVDGRGKHLWDKVNTFLNEKE